MPTSAATDFLELANQKYILSSNELYHGRKLLKDVSFYLINQHTDCWHFYLCWKSILSQKKGYFENGFYGRPKIPGISRESILLITALYAILENRSYDKALLKFLYLNNAFVLFINLGHFVIIEESISFSLVPVSLSQFRGTVGMFNNFFINKRCIRPRICYCRKMPSCKFSLVFTFLFSYKPFQF